MVCRVSAAISGATRMVCAMIIACGVTGIPPGTERAGAREQEIDREPDRHWRQSPSFALSSDNARLAAEENG